MFDSVLKRDTLPKRRFGVGLFIGILVYAGVAGFAFLALGRVEERGRHEVEVTFVKPAPPPPPPAARTQQSRPKPREPARPQVVLPQAIVAPTQVPEAEPPEQEPVASMAIGGVEGGIEGGEVGGVPGGLAGGVADATGVPMEFDARMTHPEYLGGPTPQYTEKAIAREVQGTMIVKCVVTVEGRVHGCRVLKGLPFMDRAMIDALERRRYKPAMLGGRPVEVDYTFRITLRLPD